MSQVTLNYTRGDWEGSLCNSGVTPIFGPHSSFLRPNICTNFIYHWYLNDWGVEKRIRDGTPISEQFGTKVISFDNECNLIIISFI